MAAAVLAVVASLANRPPAGASPLTQTLHAGQVTLADLPLPGGVTPTDGRLRGPRFTAAVTDVAWPASAAVGKLTTVAPAGDRLVAFNLRLSEPGELVGGLDTSTAVTAAVEIDGNQLAVPLTAIDRQIADQSAGNEPATATAAYAFDVPDKDHDVVLALTQSGFTQRFDLWTLERQAPAPTVLYRDPSASSVTSTSRGSTKLTITNPSTGFVTQATVSLTGATLGYFAPNGSGTTPSSPTAAFLSVTLEGTYTTAGGTLGAYLGGSPLPGSQLTFTPVGGAPVTATSAPHPGDHHQGPDDGLFDAYYWFSVPAGTTTGTLTVDGGPVTGAQFTNFSSTGTTQLTVTQGSIPVTFPDPPASPEPQSKPWWIGGPAPTATGSSVSVPGKPTGGFPLWAAVLLLVAVVAGTFGAERLVRWRRLASAGPPDGARVTWAAPATETRPSPPTEEATFTGSLPPAVTRTLGGPDDLVVRVLGPVEITGWVEPPERRGAVEELCSFFALHPGRSFTTAELLAAVWPVGGDRPEATPKTARNHLSRLRRAVGPEHFPDAVTSGGYQLRDVVTDWGEFQRLTAQADATTAQEADRLRAEALSLVRGAPLADARGVQYGWAYAGSLASAMTVAVANCARRLSADRLAAGDPVSAEEAARAGLRGAPEDEGLWLAAERAGRASGDRARLARLRRDMAAAIGAERAEALAARLDEE